MSVCRSQVILSSVNHVPAEHSTSLDRESAALAAPMGTPCLLLARETAPIDAYAGFADSSKGHCRGIVLLFSAGLDFRLLKLPVIAIVLMFWSELEDYHHRESHQLVTV